MYKFEAKLSPASFLGNSGYLYSEKITTAKGGWFTETKFFESKDSAEKYKQFRAFIQHKNIF